MLPETTAPQRGELKSLPGIKIGFSIMGCHRYKGTAGTAIVGIVYRRGEVHFNSILYSSIDMCYMH